MKLSAVLATVAIAAAIAVWAPWASSAGSGSGSLYEPVLDPANFATTIDNPYFPLPLGRTLTYRGVKDGQTQEDRVTVTDQTKTVAEGITARVVTDVATHDGALLEKTSDWYAQDKQGNVWYLGEDTAHYLPSGKVDTSGSWEAGVHDAEPGIVMEAKPGRGHCLDRRPRRLDDRSVRNAQERPDHARGDAPRTGRIRPEGVRTRDRHRSGASAHWRAGVRRARQRHRLGAHRVGPMGSIVTRSRAPPVPLLPARSRRASRCRRRRSDGGR